MRQISLSKERLRNKESFATEKGIAALRAINGAEHLEPARHLCTDVFLPAMFSKAEGQRLFVCESTGSQSKASTVMWGLLSSTFHFMSCAFVFTLMPVLAMQKPIAHPMSSWLTMSPAPGHRLLGSHTNFPER
jgi:hypothetical protein